MPRSRSSPRQVLGQTDRVKNAFDEIAQAVRQFVEATGTSCT